MIVQISQEKYDVEVEYISHITTYGNVSMDRLCDNTPCPVQNVRVTEDIESSQNKNPYV